MRTEGRSATGTGQAHRTSAPRSLFGAARMMTRMARPQSSSLWYSQYSLSCFLAWSSSVWFSMAGLRCGTRRRPESVLPPPMTWAQIAH